MADTTYTPQHLAAIKLAYAQGATRVKYADKEVEYRSLAEMREIIGEIEVELGLKVRRSKKYIQHTKGLK